MNYIIIHLYITLDYLSARLCIPNKKKKNVNVKVSNLIKRINESKSLVKYISCDCKFRFDE